MEVFLARQAIFDRQRRLHAYELLFRSNAAHNRFDGSESASATMQVISSTLLSIGLEGVLSGKKAFINFDNAVLRGGLHLSLPRHAIVIELLESVEPTPDLIALCRSVREQGYSIALDDFVWLPEFDPLTRIADVIKVDVQATTKPEQERLLQSFGPQGVTMLAEKVETHEEFEWASRAGYDLFQGYFFARPVVVRGRQIPAVKTTCLRLLAEIQKTNLDFPTMESLICDDVSLTYKLLRYVNSALFGRRETVDSIRRAMIILGEDGIRRWVVLAALPMLATSKPDELVTLSLVRARFCERLAELTGVVAPSDGFFTGMFSLLNALLDQPLDESLRDLNLPPSVTEVLLGTAPESGVLCAIYRLAQRYEMGSWDEVEQLARHCGVSPAAVADAYVASAVWAEQALRAGGSRAQTPDAELAAQH
jgi:EAL and modified HD-GYP domain-containing signal transduction protein